MGYSPPNGRFLRGASFGGFIFCMEIIKNNKIALTMILIGNRIRIDLIPYPITWGNSCEISLDRASAGREPYGRRLRLE